MSDSNNRGIYLVEEGWYFEGKPGVKAPRIPHKRHNVWNADRAGHLAQDN